MISRRFNLRFALAGVLVGCTHGEPFGTGIYTPGTPPGSGSLVRITFNLGADRSAAWLPDGSGILYSLERLDRRDRDRCLGLLPPFGGALLRMDCVVDVAADDSVDALSEPAVSRSGRLAYVLASGSLALSRPLAPDAQGLVVATMARPLDVHVVRTLPYTAANGQQHWGIAHLHWLDSTQLVFVAQRVTYPQSCAFCPTRDTVDWGLIIARLDVSLPTPAESLITGTEEASSVSPGGTADTIYWTKNGDTRVFRTALSSGQTAVAYDFGAAGIARDVDVAGSTLAVIVGGNVVYYADPVYGLVQRDQGGFLHVVNLATGSDATLGDSTLLFRRPSLVATGSRLVADGGPPGGAPDLWLVQVP